MGRLKKITLVTMICNVILIGLRFCLASLSGSIVLKATAWHSFVDVFITCIVLISNYIILKSKESYRHIFEKVESVLSIVLALLIFYMGYEIWTEALCSDGEQIKFVKYIIIGSIVDVVFNYIISHYKIKIGNELKSRSLIADGYHSKMDMYCSVVILAGIAGISLGTYMVYKVAALIALIVLVHSGYEILSENVKFLFKVRNKCNFMGGKKGHS